MMIRRVAAACALSAVAVFASATSASAVPGTVKVSSLRARSVARAETASVLPAPPPPRHFEPATNDDLPHTGPAIPAPLATTGGGVLVLIGAVGLAVLGRRRSPS